MKQLVSIFICLLFFISCLQEEAPATQVETKFSIILEDIPSEVPIDSIMVEFTTSSIDTILVFTKDIASDTLQFKFTIQEGDEIDLQFEVFSNGLLIKSGASEFQSGSFSQEVREQQSVVYDSVLIDSIQKEVQQSSQPRLQVGFLGQDTLTLAEGSAPTIIEVVIEENNSSLLLEDSCVVQVKTYSTQSGFNSKDYTMDSTLVFEKGSTVNSGLRLLLNIPLDSLVEGQENFNIDLHPLCDELTLSESKSIHVQVLDQDSLKIHWLTLEDTVNENLANYEFKFQLEFSPEEARLQDSLEIQIDSSSNLSPSTYQINESLKQTISPANGHRDTMIIPVDFDLDNDTQNDNYFLHLTIKPSDALNRIKINGESDSKLMILNDDFEYYFVSDTLSNEIHILDIQFNLIKSKPFDEPTTHIYSTSPDSIVLNSTSGIRTWELSKDSVQERLWAEGWSPNSASNSIETDEFIYYTRISEDWISSQSKTWETFGSGDIMCSGFRQIIPEGCAVKGAVQLIFHDDSSSYDIVFYDTLSNQVMVLATNDWTGTFYASGLLDYSNGVMGSLKHSNGNNYYSMTTNVRFGGDLRGHKGYVFTVDADSLKNVVDYPELTVEQYKNWPIKDPRGLAESPDGNIVIVDGETEYLTVLDPNSGAIISKHDLSSFTSDGGLWDVFYHKSTVKIE